MARPGRDCSTATQPSWDGARKTRLSRPLRPWGPWTTACPSTGKEGGGRLRARRWRLQMTADEKRRGQKGGGQGGGEGGGKNGGGSGWGGSRRESGKAGRATTSGRAPTAKDNGDQGGCVLGEGGSARANRGGVRPPAAGRRGRQWRPQEHEKRRARNAASGTDASRAADATSRLGYHAHTRARFHPTNRFWAGDEPFCM